MDKLFERFDAALHDAGYLAMGGARQEGSSDAQHRHGLIRRWTVTSAAAHDGRPLEGLLDPSNTASKLWPEPREAPTTRSVVGERRRATPPAARPGTRRR